MIVPDRSVVPPLSEARFLIPVNAPPLIVVSPENDRVRSCEFPVTPPAKLPAVPVSVVSAPSVTASP